QMGLKLLARLAVRLRDIDGDAPTHLLRLRRVTGLGARFPKLTEHAAKDIHVKIRNAHVAVTPLGHEIDGLGTTNAGNPDGRVRLLEGPRPGIAVGEEVLLRVPDKRPRLGPGLDDQIKGFAKSLAAVRRIALVREILRPAADHHAGNQPPAA